jgi:hypothetical protein
VNVHRFSRCASEEPAPMSRGPAADPQRHQAFTKLTN